jgi:hypothetical protein
MNEQDRSIFIKCECHGEGMGVDHYPEDGNYYFSYWRYGLSNSALPWKERLRHCWHVLTKGKAFNDEIILNQKGADELIDFLLGYKRIPKEKMDKLMEAVNKAFKDKHRSKTK